MEAITKIRSKILSKNLGLILLSIFELIAGIFILIDHEIFTIVLCIIGGITTIIAGIMFGYFYFKESPIMASRTKDLSKCLLFLTLGCFLCFNYRFFIDIFPVLTMIHGIFLLVVSIYKIQKTIDLIRLKKPYIISLVTTLITLTLSLIIIFNPFKAANAIWIFIGISLIISSIFEIVTLLTVIKIEKDIITVE